LVFHAPHHARKYGPGYTRSCQLICVHGYELVAVEYDGCLCD
jgi:hypothetical protein